MNFIKYIYLFLFILPLYAEVDYNSEVQPIFNNNCISCHIDGGTYFGGLDLSSYSEVMQGGNSGNTIIPFDYENSLLWQYISTSYMPPYGSGIDFLNTSQIDLIAQWIDEGALFEPEEDPIEGRWIPMGFNNVMYEFLNGLRYTYYCPDENGCDETYWNSLTTSDAIPNPNPYDANPYIITIDLFFGNEATYTLDWRCEGQVVDFYYDEDDITEGLHSTMYRLGFDYINSECNICSVYDEQYCSWIPGCQWDYDTDVCFENSNECLSGDVNGDETTNILDVVSVLNIILGGEFINCGDINEDGIINVLDIVLLIETILSPQLPEECYIVPEVGPCDGICPTFFYNQSSNQCEEFITGCCGVEAFNTLLECQNSCE